LKLLQPACKDLFIGSSYVFPAYLNCCDTFYLYPFACFDSSLNLKATNPEHYLLLWWVFKFQNGLKDKMQRFSVVNSSKEWNRIMKWNPLFNYVGQHTKLFLVLDSQEKKSDMLVSQRSDEIHLVLSLQNLNKIPKGVLIVGNAFNPTLPCMKPESWTEIDFKQSLVYY